MRGIAFNDLADHLRHGREIEFAYKGKQYSITNHSGYWYLYNDTEQILLDMCRFEEKEALVSKTAVATIDGLSIQQIFDMQIYDPERLTII